MGTDLTFAVIWTALGCLSFLASAFAKKEKWFRLFVSCGGFWIGCGVLHLIQAVKG